MSAEKQKQRMEDKAEMYYKKYKQQMSALDESILAKAKGGLDYCDYYALGMQLEQWDDYKAICEAEGNLNQLGLIPKIAYDVITATYGVAVINHMASIQPIEEEQGIIYFKKVIGSDTRGSVTAGDVLTSPNENLAAQSGYASGMNTDIHVDDAVGATVAYNFTLAPAPVRSQTLIVTIQDDAATYCKDTEGSGVLLGVGLSGTINYDTGEVDITFAAQPTIGKEIYATWQQNFETSVDLPKIEPRWDSTSIMARIYALKGTVGMLQAYGLKKRFGLMAEEELSKDLTVEINKEIGADAVRLLKAGAIGNTDWDKAPPSDHVSYYEHKQTFVDAISDAEEKMVENAGRGMISTIIGGRKVCSTLQTLDGFTQLSNGNTLGMHVFGTYNGKTVIRVPNATTLAANKAICLWKAQNPFEAALVYSPFMPLVHTSTLPAAPNPLGSMQAAAVWAGLDIVVPQFATTLTLLNT